MSTTLRPELRAKVDGMLDALIDRFYQEVPYAKHQLAEGKLDLDYYKRHNIETVLRIRLKRIVDAYAIRYFTKHDPVQAKAWAHYTDDEMLHDAMFVRDLEAVGVSKPAIYATEPLLATKLLMGYLLYGIEYEETPLAHIASVYFVEYTTTKTQPRWLDHLETILGKEKIKGARAHVGTDLEGEHADFVWEVLMSLVKTPAEEARVIDHIRNVARLYVAYFTELHEQVVAQKTGQAPELRVALTV